MSTISRTAGAAGSITVTIRNGAGQLITPVSVPVVAWYTDAARTAGVVTLTTTGSASTYTAAYTAAQAPAAAAARYLKVTIEVSTGVFSVDADDDVSFVLAVAGLDSTYVSRAEVRALPDLLNAASISDAKIDAAIAWFEAKFESYVGVAWVDRAATVRLAGNGSTRLVLPHYPVNSITAVRIYTDATAFTSLTATELAQVLANPDGTVERFGTYWPIGYSYNPRNIAIDYRHGYTPTPEDIREAAMVAIREKLLEDVSGARGNRQFSVATEQGIVRSSVPGKDRPFGIPAVDSVANERRNNHRVPAIG